MEPEKTKLALSPAHREDVCPEKSSSTGGTTLADLRKCLDDEKPPTDDKEDIGNDRDVAEYSLNSSFSDDEKERSTSVPKSGSSLVLALQNPGLKKVAFATKEQGKAAKPAEDAMDDLSLEDIEEAISNPYADMPEFYPKQLDYDPILGLPGYQKEQMEHKRKTVLKDKYWGKLLKDVYDMATAKIARPVYLSKVLSLYILHQDKLLQKRREAAKDNKGIAASPTRAGTQTAVGTTSAGKRTAASPRRPDTSAFSPDRAPRDGVSRKSSATNPFSKYISGLSTGQNSVANTEVHKRIERLEKAGVKLDSEELARESKNILVRMPPYKKISGEVPGGAERDTEFMKMLCDYSVNQGFVKKWKGES